MKPLPVTAIFGKPSTARSELAARLLEIGEKCASMRSGETCDGNAISAVLGGIAAIAGENDHLILYGEGNPLMLAQGFECGDAHGNSFSQIAYLASVVTVVEAESFLRCFKPDGVPGEFPQGYPNDLAEQLEVSDFIVMQQADNPADWELAQAMARSINPRAVIATPSAGRETLQAMLDGRYDGRAAQMESGWQQLLQGRAGFEEPALGVTLFVFEARRPFHPRRLWELLRGPLPGVFRARGFFWLATRMSQVIGMAKAGREMRFAMVGQWWAGIDRRQWPPVPEFRAEIEKKWAEPYGDRQQAIVLMGFKANFEEISRSLEACLLDDAEMETGESGWAALDDPFPAWNAPAHDHHHNHDHEEHDHAGHAHSCEHH